MDSFAPNATFSMLSILLRRGRYLEFGYQPLGLFRSILRPQRIESVQSLPILSIFDLPMQIVYCLVRVTVIACDQGELLMLATIRIFTKFQD